MTRSDWLYALRRMRTWGLATGITLALVAWLAPHQVGVLVYKLAQVSLGVVAAYWADRTLFRHAPGIVTGMPRDTLSAARLIARALVALAVIAGLTIGI